MPQYTALAVGTLITSWTLFFLALFAVGTIFWKRTSSRSSRTCEDILVLIAFILSTGLIVISTWAIVDEGQGRHQNDVSPTQLELMAKVTFLAMCRCPRLTSQSLLVGEALWTVANSLIRISACLFIYRLFHIAFDKVKAKISRAVALVLCAMHAIASVLQVFLICKPFSAQWDSSIPGACGDQLTSFIVLESTGLALDVPILVLPAYCVNMMHLSLRTRLQLIAILDMGIMYAARSNTPVYADIRASVLVISAVRLNSLYSAVSADFSYSQSYLSLLSATGTMIGIICCSAPSIKSCWYGCVRERRYRREGRWPKQHWARMPSVIYPGQDVEMQFDKQVNLNVRERSFLEELPFYHQDIEV